MPHERVRRHLALVKRRRAHEHRIDAERGGAFGGRDRRGGGLAAGAGEQRPILRHRVAHRLDREIGLVLLELRRFAVRTEDDETGQRRAEISLDVARERARVERRRPRQTAWRAACRCRRIDASAGSYQVNSGNQYAQDRGNRQDLPEPERKRPAYRAPPASPPACRRSCRNPRPRHPAWHSRGASGRADRCTC